MERPGRAWVRRWGGRAVALTVTGVSLYIVAPGLLSVFGSWPRLREVNLWWFIVLVLLEGLSLAAIWWLTRLALEPPADDTGTVTGEPPRWTSVASAQLAGNAASKVVPGGAATGGVVQAKLLIQDGQPPAAVASSLTAIAIMTSGVLMLLPVLTVPALIIGPPPAKQLQLGVVVSVVMAVLIVGVGVSALTWSGFVVGVGRAAGHVVHLVRPSVTADGVATSLVAQRDRVAAAFRGRWWRAVFAASANRMLDFTCLVAALAALGAHARPSEVLLAYVLAQALAIIPLTPGGLGFVESGLTGLLIVIGVPPATAAIGVLLYRLVSFWLPIPVGALAWAGWRINLHQRTKPAG